MWLLHSSLGARVSVSKQLLCEMATINGFTGQQFTTQSKGYSDHAYQYATSSYCEVEPTRIAPGAIVYPKNKSEIALTLQYAREQKIAVAVRCGGHQYSGASSTTAPNIQMDIGHTFRADSDRRFFESDGEAFAFTSVSWPLSSFATWLKSNHAFVPHGQCINVHLGGHVQTGGYGQLARSFGLLGDHVVSLDIVDYQGNNREVTRKSDPELFYALLGGSPGNLAVITHFTLKVHLDKEYVGSRGVKSMHWYSTDTLKRLLRLLARMSSDSSLPRNYDYTVNVLSSSNKLLALFPGIDGRMREIHPELYGKDGMAFWPRVIVVFAQWVPFSPTDDPTSADWFFDEVRKDSVLHLPVETKPMSILSEDWLFKNIREFDHPYMKSTRATNSKTLVQDGWAEWLTGRIDAIVRPEANRCWLSAQVQLYGGDASMFVKNADNGTAYSWRKDITVLMTLDCFYKEGYRDTATAWQKQNDEEGVGPNGKYCKEDRRVLWGSFGGFDLNSVWNMYYEDRAKYERLGRTRQRMDPEGTLSPNPFAVSRVKVL